MLKYKNILCIIIGFFASAPLFFNPSIYAKDSPIFDENPKVHTRGVWVSCFSEKKVVYSKEAALELIEFCKKANINEIYLQFYRAGQAYYDSKITDRSKYEDIVKSSGIDTISFLLKEAKKSNVKIFAWVNILSLSQNKKADILVKFGDSILTRDQYLRPSMKSEQVNESDKYYLRDEQLFLEPGDLRVSEYVVSIVNEIITRYPAISGIHLDYIRYPYPVPYIPRSNFNKYGLTYGYGEKNIARFKEKTGLDPLRMDDTEDSFLRWDNWKRQQVTSLVMKIRESVNRKSPDLLVSYAVIPSAETAYSVAFQDWPLWLEKGYADYVVLMNYTRNNQLTKEIVRSGLAHRGKGKVFTGIGVFLMKNDPGLFFEQYKIIEDLKPDGIVFFSDNDIQ